MMCRMPYPKVSDNEIPVLPWKYNGWQLQRWHSEDRIECGVSYRRWVQSFEKGTNEDERGGEESILSNCVMEVWGGRWKWRYGFEKNLDLDLRKTQIWV
ncbi:hypothetical protein SLEP1_g39457 [Rubroshorea leprosula]|uniref:Uncharacterized protein n=1 Tax=Rubroshorea leprosula TaxID=152421 RepID=A0AAV5L088_9ROSI|nr:hypothetical protein SLEP1_g39457 [Rubroshorea leprosula]